MWNRNRVLVMDLEMACWAGARPQGMYNDIIQIGMVEIDTHHLAISSPLMAFVRPTRPYDISEYCVNLTGITAADVARGNPLPEVFNRVIKRGFRKKTCLTWGNDRHALREGLGEEYLAHNQMDLSNCMDLGWMFKNMFDQERSLSVEQALEFFGLKFSGVPHTALYDAHNTARIYVEMLRMMRKSVPAPVSDVEMTLG
jgi:inhibitor of KinA sporulation pathway (predicted exonuclease)